MSLKSRQFLRARNLFEYFKSFKVGNGNKSENTYANMYAVPQAPVHEEMAQPYIPHESHAETPKNGTNASVVIMVLGAMFITLAGFVLRLPHGEI